MKSSLRWLLAALVPLLAFSLPLRAQDDDDNPQPARPKREKVERPKRETPPWMAVYHGKYKKAIEGFTKALAENPKDLEAQLGLARAKDETGDYDGEEKLLRSVLEAKADHREARALLADLLLLRGRRDEALAEAEVFLKKDAGDPIGRAVKGLVLLDKGTFGKCKACEGKGKVKDQDDKEETCTGCDGVGQVADAEPELNASLDAYQSSELGDPDDLFHVALAAREYGNRAGDSGTLKMVAHDLVPKIVEADKFYHVARCLEAGLYVEKDNAPDATKTYKEVLDINSYHPLAHVGRAYVAIHDQRLDEAERECARALQVNPNLYEAHELLAHLHLWDQEHAEAAAEIEAMLKVNPASTGALGLVAATHLLKNDMAKFAEVEKKVLALNPRCGAFYDTVGQVALSVMRFDAAEAYFKKAFELDPKLWPALLNRGVVMLHLGREDEGRKLVQQGFDKDAFNTRAYNLLSLFTKMDEKMPAVDHGRFRVRVNRGEEEVIEPYLLDWLKRADDTLSAKYGFKPEGPILVEDFALHNDFSVRTAGIPGLGALGACFGRVVTLILPTDAVFRMTQEFNWTRVLWHEYTHVVTLQLSKNRVPRWFTEGLSVYEEKAANPTWAREMELELYNAWRKGDLLGLAELNRGFTRPKYPMQVLMSYYQASLVCEYIVKKWGFPTVPKMLKAYGDEKSTVDVVKECCGVSIEEFDKGFWAFLTEFFAPIKVPPAYSDKEVKTFEAAVEKDAKDVKAHTALAWASIAGGKPDDAREHAKKVIEADPSNGDALCVLGYLADDKKDAAEARKYLLAARVDYFGLHLRLGRLLMEAKETEKAIEEFEKAKAVFPTRVEKEQNPYYFLIKIYKEDGGKRDKMLAEMEALRAIDQDDFALRRELADQYKKDKRPADVARVLEEANQIKALDAKLHEDWAAALRELKRWDDAVRELEVAASAYKRASRGAESDEKVSELRCDMAEVFLEQKKTEEAAKALDDAEYAFPKSERAKKLREQMEGGEKKPEEKKPEEKKPEEKKPEEKKPETPK